jgi:hypothetical protein
MVVPAESRRPGNLGYGRLKVLRVLVYSRLKGLENDTRIVEHLRKHRQVIRSLGLSSVPNRTTIGRWGRRYLSLLEEVFERLSSLLQLLMPTSHLIADSTPLVDLYYLEAEYVLADAGYASKSNIQAVETIGAEPVLPPNPRRGGKRRRLKHRGILRAKRYLVEQFNGLIKNHVSKGCWTKPKGMTKKTAMVTAGLISLNATAMNALLQSETSLKALSQYCVRPRTEKW